MPSHCLPMFCFSKNSSWIHVSVSHAFQKVVIIKQALSWQLDFRPDFCVFLRPQFYVLLFMGIVGFIAGACKDHWYIKNDKNKLDGFHGRISKTKFFVRKPFWYSLIYVNWDEGKSNNFLERSIHFSVTAIRYLLSW